MDFFRKARVEVSGVNFGELVALVQKSQISVNFRRIGDTVMLFETSPRNLPILFDILTKKCYTYKVFRPKRLNFWQLCGFLAGALIMLTAIFIFSQFCWGVKVVAEKSELNQKIAEFLDTQDLVAKSWKSIDCDTLETQILNAISEVGLVSVNRQGAFLVVNTISGTQPQATEPILDTSAGIFADRDGIVSRIFVASGTALVKVGDTVSLGQMLVAPYSLTQDGTQNPVSVRADVYLYAWESSGVEFCENSLVYVRTGEFVTETQTQFCGATLTSTSAQIPFEHYEIQTSRRYLSSILPIAVETTYYYQTEAVAVRREFEAEKEALIYEAKQKLLLRIDECQIIEQKHTINQIGDKYYINFYAKCEYKVG